MLLRFRRFGELYTSGRFRGRAVLRPIAVIGSGERRNAGSKKAANPPYSLTVARSHFLCELRQVLPVLLRAKPVHHDRASDTDRCQ